MNVNRDGLDALLKLFQAPAKDVKTAQVIKVEKITPDSEAVLTICNSDKGSTAANFYVLYNEDYIPSLKHVSDEIEKWFPSKVVKFIAPIKEVKFEKTPGAKYYMQPDTEMISKWMPYAAPYGFRYMFMAQIKPTKSNTSYWAN